MSIQEREIGNLEERISDLCEDLGQAERVITETGKVVERLRQERDHYRDKYMDERKRIAALERGEFICKKCGLRKDSERQEADF